MTGSSAAAPTTPEGIRASDSERDRAVGELSERFAEGRLSRETFMHRVDAALGAKNRRELARLVADLPPRRRAAGFLAVMAAGVSAGARRAVETLAAERDALAGALGGAAGARPGTPLAAAGRQALPLSFPPGPGSRFTIGRDRASDLLIEDPTVSRRHASLSRDDGGWLLADEESSNGTRLNGWRVRGPVRVRAGDRVAFGGATFVFRAGDQGTPSHG